MSRRADAGAASGRVTQQQRQQLKAKVGPVIHGRCGSPALEELRTELSAQQWGALTRLGLADHLRAEELARQNLSVHIRELQALHAATDKVAAYHREHPPVSPEEVRSFLQPFGLGAQSPHWQGAWGEDNSNGSSQAAHALHTPPLRTPTLLAATVQVNSRPWSQWSSGQLTFVTETDAPARRPEGWRLESFIDTADNSHFLIEGLNVFAPLIHSASRTGWTARNNQSRSAEVHLPVIRGMHLGSPYPVAGAHGISWRTPAEVLISRACWSLAPQAALTPPRRGACQLACHLRPLRTTTWKGGERMIWLSATLISGGHPYGSRLRKP